MVLLMFFYKPCTSTGIPSNSDTMWPENTFTGWVDSDTGHASEMKESRWLVNLYQNEDWLTTLDSDYYFITLDMVTISAGLCIHKLS